MHLTSQMNFIEECHKVAQKHDADSSLFHA